MPEQAGTVRRLPKRFLVELALLGSVLAMAMAVTGDAPTRATATPLSTPTREAPLATASAPASSTTKAPATSPVPPVPSAPSAPTAASTASTAAGARAAAPRRLEVPSIGVDSELMALGLQADGTLEVPPDGFPAGWYTGAPNPGEIGPAIIAGHVDWGGRPGVFFDLRDLSPGDDIVITRHDGSTARFRVTHTEQFDKDAFPTRAVYGDIDHAGLRLITCAGVFDPNLRSYGDNLVVFAELVGATPA